MSKGCPTSIISESHAHLQSAISELRKAGVSIPISLYKASHALAYGVRALDMFAAKDPKCLDDRGTALLKAICGPSVTELLRGSVR